MTNPCNKDRTLENVRLFIGGMTEDSRYAIQQFLEWFDVDSELNEIVHTILKYKEERRRNEAESLRSKARRRPDRVDADQERRGLAPSEPRPLTPMGICKCGGVLTGEPVPGCETKLNGRVFYKECDTCSYYSELFKIDNIFKEIEGG